MYADLFLKCPFYFYFQKRMDIRPQAESVLNACGSQSGKSGIPRFILVLWSLMKYILLGKKKSLGGTKRN